MGWYKQGPNKKAKSRAERIARYREAAISFEKLYDEERAQHRTLENSIWAAGLGVFEGKLDGDVSGAIAIKSTLDIVVEHLADVETEEEALPAVHAALRTIRAYEAARKRREQEEDE